MKDVPSAPTVLRVSYRRQEEKPEPIPSQPLKNDPGELAKENMTLRAQVEALYELIRMLGSR